MPANCQLRRLDDRALIGTVVIVGRAGLYSLSYSVVKAQAALASFPRDSSMPLEERLRQALAYFARP